MNFIPKDQIQKYTEQMKNESRLTISLAGKASFQLVRFLLFLTRIIPLKLSYSFCSFIVFAGSRLKWKRSKKLP